MNVGDMYMENNSTRATSLEVMHAAHAAGLFSEAGNIFFIYLATVALERGEV